MMSERHAPWLQSSLRAVSHCWPLLPPVQLPVAPQYVLFVIGSMHWPAHVTPAHAHALDEHELPFVHAFWHAPQLFGSPVRSTHTPLQRVCVDLTGDPNN